jgi:hypothetical protein
MARQTRSEESVLDLLANLNRAKLFVILRKVNREKVAPLLHGFLIDNFTAGGKPKFKKNSKLVEFMKRIGGAGGAGHPLVNSGTLFTKAILDPVIKTTETSITFKIRNPTAAIEASAEALHDGKAYSIFKTPKMRSFFWAMYYEAKQYGEDDIAETFKRLALSPVPGVSIVIPPRPWTKFSMAQLNVAKKKFKEEVYAEMEKLVSKSNTRKKS